MNEIKIKDNIRRTPYKINWENIRNVEREVKEVGATIDQKFITSVLSSNLSGKAPLGIVYETPTEDVLNSWLGSMSGYIEGLFSFNGEPLFLEPYQERWINDDSTFKWCGKSRRVGLSLGLAVRSLAESQLTDINKDWTFISYTMEEAINKIDYARAIYDLMPTKFKRKKMRDRRQSLEFDDPLHRTKTRLLSHAQRAPRGGGGSLLYDEFAHFIWARILLEAGMACILTAEGSLEIVSTPLGEGDPFHEIGINHLKRYPNFNRHNVYWWECSWLCINPMLARSEAPKMSTEQRVYKFGTIKLKQIFQNYMDLESFQQEMEVKFLAETYRYFPLQAIKDCVYPHIGKIHVDKNNNKVTFDSRAFDEDTCGIDVANDWEDTNGTVHPSVYNLLNIYKNNKDVKFFRCSDLEELAVLVQKQFICRDLIAGYDVGREKDKSEFVIFEEIMLSGGKILMIERYSQSFERAEFPEQRSFLFNVLNLLQTLRLAVDYTGMGGPICEDLQRAFFDRIEAIKYTDIWKSDACKLIKLRLQAHAIAIAEDRDTISHFYSIRRSLGKNKQELFSADKMDRGHHGDKFWARCMASWIATKDETLLHGNTIDSNIMFGNRSKKIIELGGIKRVSGTIFGSNNNSNMRPVTAGGLQIGSIPRLVLDPYGVNSLPMPEGIYGLKWPT